METKESLRVGVRFPRWLWFLIGFTWMETWVEWRGEKLAPKDARLVESAGVECSYTLPGWVAPGLSSLLDQLAEKGYTIVKFRPADNPGGPLEGTWVAEEMNTPYPDREDYDPRDPYRFWGGGRTREEAAASLLRAVG